uniref:Choline/ethanolamine kinase n=1 Tax=Globodera rostochiensis TaxID=31243 RepID=A0A914GU16_GLORO
MMENGSGSDELHLDLRMEVVNNYSEGDCFLSPNHQRIRRNFTPMEIQRDKHLRSMKELLSTMDPQVDPNSHIEFKEKTHILCARFLGGAWKTVSLEDMKIHRIKGGMSNMLFLCRLTENHPPIKGETDKVLLRVYFNPETESHLVAESVIFTLLSERHLGPKLYGIFSGGRLEEYIPSRPLTCHEIAMPNMANKIAKRLARVHQLEVPIWKEPEYICDALERWLAQLRQMPSGSLDFDLPVESRAWAPPTINCNDLQNEIEQLRSLIVKSRSVVTFCHNDLQEGNILLPKAHSGNIRIGSESDDVSGNDGHLVNNSLTAYNPMDPRLVLIDFEYASYNYRGFDFANHFVEYSINYDKDEPPFYEMLPEKFPSEKQMLEFMYNYEKELHPTAGEDHLREVAFAMVKETVPFVPISHLLWGVWGLLQMEVSPVDFGFAEYGRDRLSLYYKNKPILKMFADEQGYVG